MSHGKNDWVIDNNIKRGMHLNKQGRIILASGKLFTGTTIQTNGYINIYLSTSEGDTTKYGFQVGRVICWLAYGPPKKGEVADHINRVKADNRPCNLRWATRSANALNVSNTGRYWQLNALKKGQLLKGSDVGNSKVTEDNVKEMFKLRSQALPQKDIASKFNISRSHVTDILNRKKGKWDWVIIPKKHLVNKRNDQKLFDKDVWKIEKLIKKGKMLQKDIAKKFNVSPSKITYIKNGMK